MQTSLETLKAHQHAHHKTVTRVLRQISKETDIPVAEVRQDFIDGEHAVTVVFWQILREHHGDKFDYVYFCQGCQKFNLLETE